MTSGRLAERKVLVAGAGQRDVDDNGPPGIGKAISVACATQGASVAIADIDPAAGDVTAGTVRDITANCVSIGGDASREDDMESMVQSTVSSLGGLDGLVMNVGAGRIGPDSGGGLAGVSEHDWDKVFATNVRSHAIGCKLAIATMSAGGAIVLISSIAALCPINDLPAYHASKAALDGLCRYAAYEGAQRNIRVNVVVPGFIDTPLGRKASRRDPSRATRNIPLGRQGTAVDIAHAVTFLLSTEAGYITGQSLVVDGGYTALRPDN